MPEERNRIEVDRLSALLLCPDARSAAQLEAEGVRGRREVVGDVMYDATRVFAPIARRLATVAHERPYAALTIHRQANTEPDRLRAIVDALSEAGRRFVFPVHPRTSTRSRCRRTSRRRRRSATWRCSRSSPRRTSW
jgi:UDP-N-acetylglucosamine 2-epimerase